MFITKTLKSTIREIDKYSPYPLLYSFVMTKNEKRLFDETVKESKVYLEFGMGGSTFRALKKSSAKIYSIDSSTDWIRLMREYWLIRRMEKRRLKLCHVNIGPTELWGVPIGSASKELYPNYSASIFSSIDAKSIDTVLIDGRFRVACTLKTVFECYTNETVQILIHDFSNRPDYHTVLKYLELTAQVDTLGVFRIKKDINLNLVQQEYDLYKFNPS